ncbi:MAG: hypothetical protein ABW039_07230 [Sphingobium sp.]
MDTVEDAEGLQQPGDPVVLVPAFVTIAHVDSFSIAGLVDAEAPTGALMAHSAASFQQSNGQDK